MRKTFCTLFLVSLFAVLIVETIHAEDCAVPDLMEKIDQMLKHKRYRPDSWGIQIVDLQTDRVLYTRNADHIFIPASNTKLFTTGTALAKLKPDFRLKTQVYSVGSVSEQGVLAGNLILEGRGDPSISTAGGSSPDPFSELARQVAARGINQVNGDLIGDDSYFVHSTTKVKNQWGDFEMDHGLPMSALSINGGVTRVFVSPGDAVGKKIIVHTEPETSFFTIVNKGTTSSRRTKRTLKIKRRGKNQIAITGRLPVSSWGASYTVVTDNPPYFAASLFKEALEKEGIKVVGKIKTNHSQDNYPPGQIWVLLATHESEPLINLIDIINKRSLNPYAEMLLRIIGAELKEEGSVEAGLEAEREFLAEIGINGDDISLTDGSGLSKRNLVTPRAITHLLEYMHKTDYFDPFFNSLAVSGVDGTLKRRLKFPSTIERIHAKTGTLANALSLSGYLSTNCGRKVVFSIIANRFRAGHHQVRSTIDDICNLVVNYY